MPFDLKTAVPHRGPMLLVDDLLSADEDTAVTSFEVKADNIFVDEGGALSRCALIEIMAQSLAAKSAFKAYGEGKNGEKGFLVMLKNIEFFADAKAGDVLKCAVKVSDFISRTYIAHCEISAGDNLLASGELRIYCFE